MADKRDARPWPPAWLDLFDASEMEHACEVVRADARAVAQGLPAATHKPLRRLLVAPLDGYIGERWRPSGVDIAAAVRLRDLAEELAAHFERRGPFTEPDADAWAARLRLAWLEFVAFGAGHRMYSDLPKERQQRTDASRLPRGGWPSCLSVEDVETVLNAPDAPTKYEAAISALCERARANANPNKPPRGGPEATAKRRYRDAVKAGRIKPVSQRR